MEASLSFLVLEIDLFSLSWHFTTVHTTARECGEELKDAAHLQVMSISTKHILHPILAQTCKARFEMLSCSKT